MPSDFNVDALTRLVGGAKNVTRRREVANALGVSEHSLYQIVSGVMLPSGRPKSVGSILRRKLDASFPGWNLRPEQQQPSVGEALHVVLKAIERSSHKEELQQLLPLVVSTNAKTYKLRLEELLVPSGDRSALLNARSLRPQHGATAASDDDKDRDGVQAEHDRMIGEVLAEANARGGSHPRPDDPSE